MEAQRRGRKSRLVVGATLGTIPHKINSRGSGGETRGWKRDASGSRDEVENNAEVENDINLSRECFFLSLACSNYLRNR